MNTKQKFKKPKGKNFQKGMTKKNSNRAQRREAEDLDGQEKTFLSKGNPIEFYNHFPQMMLDAGRGVPFANPVGTVIQNVVSNQQRAIGNPHYRIPGVMRIGFFPAYGYSANKNSAINRSADKFYMYMRSHLKTSGNYDAADQIMGMLALDNLYMWHSILRRLYGTSDTFTAINYDYPHAVVRAQGFNPDVFCNGQVRYQLRQHVNYLAATLAHYTQLNNVDIFKRHEWMCSGLYTDDDTTRAQTYLFAPEGLWAYDNLRTTGTSLKWMPFPVFGEGPDRVVKFDSLEQVFTYTNNLLQALQGDDDITKICGDLLNAFGAENMTRLAMMPEEYLVLPAYDKVVLSQIENATFVNDWATDYTPTIGQDPTINSGAILFTPDIDGRWANEPGSGASTWLSAQNRLVNMHEDSPSVESVIEATRLTLISEFTGEQPLLTSFGSDLATRWSIFMDDAFVGNNDLNYSGTNMTLFNPNLNTTDGSYKAVLHNVYALNCLSAFDWHPMVATMLQHKSDSGAWVYELAGINFDADNIGTVSYQALDEIHRTCLFSMFDIPEMKFMI